MPDAPALPSRAGAQRILGVDPGTIVLGYGLVEAAGSRLRAISWGVVRAPRSASIGARLLVIHRALADLFVAHRPDVVALERVFFGRSAASALRIGEARGAVLLTASLHGVPVSEYAPALVKRAVVGSGAAPKGQVQEMVRRILSLEERPEPEDASDALALGICHANRRGAGGAKHAARERLLMKEIVRPSFRPE